MRRWTAAVFIILTIFASSACSNARRAHAEDTSRGKEVYDAQCASCHGAQGIGGPVAQRPLKGERRRRSAAQVRTIVLDPDPPMPKLFPSQLTAADVRDVTAYVESL